MTTSVDTPRRRLSRPTDGDDDDDEDDDDDDDVPSATVVVMTRASSSSSSVETVPHEKSPPDAPMTKTIARRGDDGARVVPLGATCYGASPRPRARIIRDAHRDSSVD